MVKNKKSASSVSSKKSKSAAKRNCAENTSTRKKSSRQSSHTSSAEKKKRGTLRNIKYLGGALFKKMVRAGTSELRSNAEEVNNLNVFPVPDGDTGDNMRMTIESGIAAIENIDSDDLADVMKIFSHGTLIGARGNSGVILSQFFAGMANGLENESEAGPTELARALEKGVEQAYTSVMTPTEGTILTVAREAVEYAVNRMTPQSTIVTLFKDLLEEMHNSLNRTPEILTVLKEAGVVDSGGAGLYYIMDGFNRALNGEEVSDSSAEQSAKSNQVNLEAFGPDSEMTYGYCTEFLLQLQNSKTDIAAFDTEKLKAFLASIGDSVVAFKTESIVKVHVHTKTPEKVLAYAREYGEFLTVKIENMSLQHTESQSQPEENKEAPKQDKKMYGIVAVSNGDGISSVFREFGADEIVLGGQTNNPSTGEFLEAFDKINAEHIFVFPNNSNIIMAAEQSAEIYDKAKVHVVQSKNIGAGYVALSSIDLCNPDPESIIDTMNEAISRISTGYVSPAIRDADMNGVHIDNGDTIGIIGKEIVVSSADRLETVKSLVSKLLDGDKYMLTVFYGKDSNEDERQKIGEELQKDFGSLEYYFIEGGQEIAPYIFVAE